MGGLKDRAISSSDPRRRFGIRWYKSAEDQIMIPIKFSLIEVREKIVELVQSLTNPIFEIFNFLRIDKEVCKENIREFLKKNSLQ